MTLHPASAQARRDPSEGGGGGSGGRLFTGQSRQVEGAPPALSEVRLSLDQHFDHVRAWLDLRDRGRARSLQLVGRRVRILEDFVEAAQGLAELSGLALGHRHVEQNDRVRWTD